MEFMALLNNIDIKWVDGVNPSNISNKALSFGIDPATIWDNILGSWRGNMNAIRQ